MGCGGCREQNAKQFQVPKPVLKTPKLYSDGSIEFPEDQPDPKIEGYEPSPDNPQILVPKEPVDCPYRVTGIMLQKDGTYRPHHVCRHSKCEHKGKQVNFDICKGCPFRNG